MTRKRFLIGLIIALIAALGLVAANVVLAAKKAIVESPQRALMLEAEQRLMSYYNQHGSYPDSLESLEFTYPDGGDASTLATLQYRTDGSYYRIVAESIWDGSEMSVCH